MRIQSWSSRAKPCSVWMFFSFRFALFDVRNLGFVFQCNSSFLGWTKESKFLEVMSSEIVCHTQFPARAPTGRVCLCLCRSSGLSQAAYQTVKSIYGRESINERDEDTQDNPRAKIHSHSCQEEPSTQRRPEVSETVEVDIRDGCLEAKSTGSGYKLPDCI